jgi:hypothetical protein
LCFAFIGLFVGRAGVECGERDELTATFSSSGLTTVAEGKDRLVRNVARSLWASVQGDPTFMRRLNGWLTIFWVVMIPVSLAMGWLKSVTYVSALSLWALVSGHWSTWQAARVEVTQQQEAAERAKNPLEEKVVDKIVERTEIGPTPANT